MQGSYVLTVKKKKCGNTDIDKLRLPLLEMSRTELCVSLSYKSTVHKERVGSACSTGVKR